MEIKSLWLSEWADTGKAADLFDCGGRIMDHAEIVAAVEKIY